MKFIDDQGRVIDPEFAESFEGQRRQDLPKLYLRDGSVYVTRRDVLMNDNSFKGRDCRAWIMPLERSCNIDTPFDLFLVERLLEYQAAHAGAGEMKILLAESAGFSNAALDALRGAAEVDAADLDRTGLLATVATPTSCGCDCGTALIARYSTRPAA